MELFFCAWLLLEHEVYPIVMEARLVGDRCESFCLAGGKLELITYTQVFVTKY